MSAHDIPMGSEVCLPGPVTLGKGIARPVEVAVAVIGLLACAPVIMVAGALVALTSHGPLIFRQKRVGLGGRTFILYKLRSMRDFRGGPQVTSRDDQRVTRVGKILRKTKLDELPELWNVLKGDMSLVGPRPEVPEYVDLANPQWALVLSVRPGITDPVTMRLRNEEGLLEIVSGDRERFYREVLQPIKLRGSLDYLLKRTWGQDTIILLRTVVSVILPNRVPAPKPKELEIQ